MSVSNDSQWKDKYLRHLDELGRKEQRWNTSLDLLRRALGRLAHIGYGLETGLDRQLDQIRDAVRAGRDAQTLEQLVRDACESAVRVHERAEREAIQLGPNLAARLTQLPASGLQGKRLERLRQRLERATGPAQVYPLMTEILSLLGEPATPVVTPPPPVVVPNLPRPGLLDRLLGAWPKPPSALPTTPATRVATETTLPPSVTAVLLEHLLQPLEPSSAAWQERLNLLRQQIATCRGEHEAAQLLETCAVLLIELLEAAEQSGELPLVVEALPSAGETLLQLLEKIEIPQHLQERLNLIKGTLGRTESPRQMVLTVQAIADLMIEIKRESQSEKQDLERFLEDVTGRICILSEHVNELGTDHEESDHSRIEFQRSLQDHMLGMRDHVQDAHEVAHLKRAISQGLDVIETQVARHMRREEALSRAAEERIADLSSRLHDIKYEAFLLQQKLEEQRNLALTDPLTGLPNRLAYEERMEVEYQRWLQYGTPLSVLVIDIDHFKRINDSFGHLAGDKALKALALRLRQNLRDLDEVARYGGEEFVVIMPTTPPEDAYRVAEKLRMLVADAGFHYQQQPVAITISGGLACFRTGDDPQQVFKRADDALYTAKQAGRNRTCWAELGTLGQAIETTSSGELSPPAVT